MLEQPKQQKYSSMQKHVSQTVDVSFICLERGKFIHIDANGQAVEIRMDDDGQVGVVVSAGVAVSTFEATYGS